MRLTPEQVVRVGDVLATFNKHLARVDDGRSSNETRICVLEDSFRELCCALLGATNPVVLEQVALPEPPEPTP